MALARKSRALTSHEGHHSRRECRVGAQAGSARPWVRAWFEAQDVDQLYLTTTVIGELTAGIERLPSGRRRAAFRHWLEVLINVDFAGRILVFDAEAALIYGKLVAAALTRGRPPTVGDAQIAAVAQRNHMAVASRDVRGFDSLGVTIIDPWLGR